MQIPKVFNQHGATGKTKDCLGINDDDDDDDDGDNDDNEWLL